MIVINETNGGVSEVTEIETTDTSAPNSSEYDQRDDSSDKDDKLMDIKFTIKWVRLTIVMAFTALFALLSISYISNNGKLEPETIFRQNPFSFILFLLVLMVAFFFAINGVIFSEKISNNQSSFQSRSSCRTYPFIHSPVVAITTTRI